MVQKNKDIQPQTKPYIVKSHDIHLDADYADWIADIKSRYRSAQVKAAVKVNAEKLLFNWQLGRDLVQKKAEDDGVDFHERMNEIHEELKRLNDEANVLMGEILKGWEELK